MLSMSGKQRGRHGVAAMKKRSALTPIYAGRDNANDDSLRVPRAAAVLVAAFTIAGCGGGSGSTGSAPSVSPVTSEADTILHMDQLRAAGYRGAGVRVGVISTGIVNLASYQTAGTLPASLFISQNARGTLDEGSWMLELVHQHAPDAELGFCDGDDLDFLGCIEDLVTNFQADVIVDDLLFSGQFYPDATTSALRQLEATNDRLVFVHLSGNEQRGGYWQGQFVAMQIQLNGNSLDALDFGSASGAAGNAFNSVSVPAGAHLILLLNWNDPPHGTNNRALTAYLLDQHLNELSHASGQSEPNLRLDYINSGNDAQTVRVAVSLDSGPSQGLALQVTQGSPTCNIECQAFTYSTAGLAGGTVGDFEDALVVGASNAQAPRTVEPWSNQGPFRLDFSASVDASAPDGFDYTRLVTPEKIMKPDIVAPDCVTVPFSNGAELHNEQFCGTSAAVPAIAGAVALLQSAGFNRTQVLKALRGTAIPLGGSPWDPAAGFGLADVAAAWKSGGN